MLAAAWSVVPASGSTRIRTQEFGGISQSPPPKY
jgi:hypothetical protein